MDVLKKLEKAFDLLKTKYLMKYKQKVYKGNKYEVKYVFQENKKSKDIIIVFTACTKVGQKARYNYIKTVEEFTCNKLFILDDFGFDGRGSYYLGKDKDFAIEKDVRELINHISKNIEAKTQYYIGSSKGGYAALYFGIEKVGSTIIVGAPQYLLGTYLDLPGHTETLRYIMGNTSKESIEELNTLLEGKLINCEDKRTKINLHFSDKEETYESDLGPLVNKLKDLKYSVCYDKESYKSHSDLTIYFPKYIKKILRENSGNQ